MGFMKKCDICGKAYEPYNITRRASDPNGFSFLNIPNYVSTSAYIRDITDCCPKHMKQIKNFINSLIEEANNPIESEEMTKPDTSEEGEGENGVETESKGSSV